MSANPYPNLGFNPVPGAVSDVAGLQGQISGAHDAVEETNGLLSRLRDSNDDVWQGDAGNAFRENFDATLAQDLAYAQSSLEKAVALIQEWHANLVNFQETAKGLESEAAEARVEHARAVTILQQAQSDPDLSLVNTTFSDAESLQAAQTRLDAAVARVRTATASVDDWQTKIDAVIKRARDLETTHDTLARRIAAELDTAAKDFAPSPPDRSIWDRITDAIGSLGEWIDKHREGIHQTLSIIAAVGSIVAVCTPPPFDIIGFAVAATATAGLIGLDVSNPDIRQGLKNGDLSAWTKVGLDSTGLFPVGGAAIKGAKFGWTALRGGGEALTAGKHAAQAAGEAQGLGATLYNAVTHDPLLTSKIIDKIPGVSKAAEAIGLPHAANDVFEVTRYVGSHSTAVEKLTGVASTIEGVDLINRGSKLWTSIADPIRSQIGSD
ncbi:hypothetical protein [Nocardia bovistercoris]|uniref:WXG100 family type VII secretion target n=1 Tax=Nocardia bovistercoris TaxID=2785916 RepID=A0A931N5G8_9NOCA|nr:hypothetical protein [Nocardia bovistercoris]MBH0778658.1 hypothetical protein [Nocardia bovistercoris]